MATTLYIESNGVYNTNPYAAASTINGISYTGLKVGENGFSTTTGNLLTNHYPTARTLFNIYSSDTVRASTGGFLNWVCDGNTNFSKGLDNSTGLNFDAELTTAIGATFGFPRLTDASSAPAIATPADGIAAPNNSCAASLPVNTTSGSNTITLASGNFPADIVNAGGLVGGGNVGVTQRQLPVRDHGGLRCRDGNADPVEQRDRHRNRCRSSVLRGAGSHGGCQQPERNQQHQMALICQRPGEKARPGAQRAIAGSRALGLLRDL